MRMFPESGCSAEPTPGPEKAARARTRADRVAGLCLSVLAAAGLAWGAGAALMGPAPAIPTDPAGIPGRERRALARLERIAAAQARYVRRDWDGDGKRTYALAPAHLWRSVRESDGAPVRVGLIPRALGFAMEPSLALDGYIFRNLYEREPGAAEQPGRPALDFEKEWAATACPVSYGQSGLLVFLAHSSGALYARDSADGGVPYAYPRDPAAAGWHAVDSLAALRREQNRPAYLERVRKRR